jgi:hypothetical protein
MWQLLGSRRLLSFGLLSRLGRSRVRRKEESKGDREDEEGGAGREKWEELQIGLFTFFLSSSTTTSSTISTS